MKICKIGHCSTEITPKSARGMCTRHYKISLKGKDPNERTDYDERLLIIEDGVVKIPIGRNARDGYALVDEEFAHLNGLKWHLTNRKRTKTHRYVASSKDLDGVTKHTKMHQLIMGKPPRGMVIDHKNGDKKDNRRANLRFATRQENAMNHSKYDNNTSGYIGAYLHKPSGGWMSKIGHKNKLIHLGTFKTAEEAARARDVAALELHGKFAVLNFPVDN